MLGPKDSPEVRREQMSAFESMASDLEFTTRHTSFDVGEHTDIGLFAGPFASPVMDFDAVDSAPVTPSDDEEIATCIKGWESLVPADYADSYTNFANGSYLLVGANGVGHVTGAEGTEDNDAFQEILANYPVFTPRQVNVSEVKVTHLGGMRACATYTVDEEYTNDTSFSGNAVAVLAKLDAGWRIFIATDHLTD